MADNLQQKTFFGVLWSLGEKFSIQAFGFVQGIILGRLLDPSDYGMVGMLAVFLGISATFADAGFCTALVRKKNRTAIDYSTVYTTNVVISFDCCIILWAISPAVADFYDTPLLKDILRVNAVYLFINSFLAVQKAHLSIQLKFKSQSKVFICSEITTGIVAIIMAFLGYGVWSLVVPCYFGFVIKAIMFWHVEHWFPRFGFSRQSFKEFFNFGSKLLATNLINSIYHNIYPVVIGKAFSATDLGYYSKAGGYAKLPSETLSGVLTKVAFPVMSEIQDDNKRLGEVYRRMISLSAYVVFPALVGMSVLAKPFIITLITSKWAASIIYLQIICYARMLTPIHSLNLSLLKVLGRSDLFLRLEIIKKILGVLVIVVTIPFGLVALCYGSVFSAVLFLVINTYYTGKFIHVGFLTQMKDILPIFVQSLFMGGIVYLATFAIDSCWLQLIIGLPVGIVAYFMISILTKSSELSYLRLLMKENILKKNK